MVTITPPPYTISWAGGSTGASIQINPGQSLRIGVDPVTANNWVARTTAATLTTTAHQWVNAFNALTGQWSTAQPSFSDLSGTATAGQGGTGTTALNGIRQANGGSADTAATGHQMLAPLLCSDTSGSGTAQSCTTTPSFTPATNDCVNYTTTAANSSTGLTVNVDALGAKSVAIPGTSGWTTTLTASIITANKPLHMCYDGTNWNVTQTGTASSGGGGGSAGGTVTYTASTLASSADNGKLVIMNCSAACAYTLPATQPSTSWFAWVISTGSTTATIALGGSDTFNGATAVPVLIQYATMLVSADSQVSTNYTGNAPLTTGFGLSGLNPSSNGVQIAATTEALAYLGTATNFGTAIGTTTVSGYAAGYGATAGIYVYQTTAGVGCSAASNTVQPSFTFTDPAGHAQTIAGPTLTISGNGTVGASSGTFAQGTYSVAYTSGNVISYTTTSTLGSTGCTTTPQYAVNFAGSLVN